MKVLKVILVLDTLELSLRASLLLSSFVGFLGSNLVKLSSTVLSALLKLAQTLDLELLFCFNAKILANLGFFTLNFFAVMLRDLQV